MRNIVFILSLALTVGLASCEKQSPSENSANELEIYFDSLANHNDFNGAVLFKENGQVVFKKAYGFANYSKQNPFKTSTQMEIASVSKQFTSMSIMMLYEKGMLNLDAPVNEYLNTPLPYDNITIRQLLTHTSGFPEYEDYFYSSWPKESMCLNKDILEYYAQYKPELLFKPGSNFKYSNGGYIVLAEVVDFVSGEPLDKYLEKNIFQPFGFKNTGFVDRNTILARENYAPGYYFNSEENTYILPDSIPGKEYITFLAARFGPGRVSTTVEELAKWDSLLTTNALLSNESLIEMYTPQPIEGVESNYAFGWRVNHDSTLGYHIYHTGNWAGNKTYISRFVNSLVVNSNELKDSRNIDEDSNNAINLPDQTLIIFNNTNSKLTKAIYAHGDRIIRQHRESLVKKLKGIPSKESATESIVKKKPLIESDPVVAGLLFFLLAFVFYTNSLPGKFWKKFYTFIPAILLCYFLPGLLNTFGIVSGKESNLYSVAINYFLPASLVLLTLTIDLKAVWKLGGKAIVMFLAGSVGIIIGGPLSILIISAFNPDIFMYNGEEVWRGMTTMAGSWIGGGANQAAMIEIFHPSKELFSQMLAVDVILANIWMAILLYFAAKPQVIDKLFRADSSGIAKIQKKVEDYQKKITRVSTFPDIMMLLGVAFGVTGLAHFLANLIAPWLQLNYPQLERYALTNSFFWIVIIATIIGILLSFTKVRRLEGVGASKFGSAFLFFLVATIGMNIDLKYLLDNPHFFLIGLVWMFFHIGMLILVGRLIRAPFFFFAVGSQANIGGPVSAPIVASAFHPSLAPVGILLAVFGYAVGTFGAYFCGLLMQMVR